MTITFSKIKLKEVSGQKQGCIQTPEASKKTQQSSKLTQQQLILPIQQKIKSYVTILGKPACTRDCESKTRV